MASRKIVDPKKDILIPQGIEPRYTKPIKSMNGQMRFPKRKKIFLKDCYFYCRKKATKRDRLITREEGRNVRNLTQKSSIQWYSNIT